MAWKRYRQLEATDAANSTSFEPGGSGIKCKLVCFPCRKVCKHYYSANCPHCGEPMKNCGKQWRFPRRNDLKGWKKEEERWLHKASDMPYNQFAPFRKWYNNDHPTHRQHKHQQPSNWYY